MSRGRRPAAPWIALAAAVAGLFGAAQITEGDFQRIGRALWRAIESLEEPAPRRPAREGAVSGPFAGHPRVIDGDTFDLEGIRVRMQGIDALERNQQCNRQGSRFACGEDAREALERLISGREVTCTPDGSVTHGRTVAVCTVPDGRGGMLDLNEGMVRSGLAFDCPRYSKGRYAAVEAAAKAAGEGVWGGRFTYPWTHRDRSGACGR